VNAKSDTSCTAYDITRQVEKHVLGKVVRRVSDQSPFGWKSKPMVISSVFTVVVFSRMRFTTLRKLGNKVPSFPSVSP
jgi:hypothetical protein